MEALLYTDWLYALLIIGAGNTPWASFFVTKAAERAAQASSKLC